MIEQKETRAGGRYLDLDFVDERPQRSTPCFIVQEVLAASVK